MVQSKSGLYDVTSWDVFYGPCIYDPYSDAGLDPGGLSLWLSLFVIGFAIVIIGNPKP